MALTKKPASEATIQEIREFLSVHDIKFTDKQSKVELLETMKLAQLPTEIVVAERSKVPAHDTTDMEEMFREPLDIAREKWCRIRLQDDPHAEDQDSVVPVIYQTDSVFLPRQTDLCLRERFVRTLFDAKETRRVQAAGDGTMKFSEASKFQQFRHPFTFYGTCGMVADGPPRGLPETTRIIGSG